MAEQKKNVGGRPTGSKTDRSTQVIRKCRKLGLDIIESMAKIATSTAECVMCNATGRVDDLKLGGVHVRPKGMKRSIRVFKTMGEATSYVKAHSEEFPDKVDIVDQGEVLADCPVCGGTGMTAAPVELRARVLQDLAQYVYPKKAAQQITGADEGPVKLTIKWAGKQK